MTRGLLVDQLVLRVVILILLYGWMRLLTKRPPVITLVEEIMYRYRIGGIRGNKLQLGVLLGVLMVATFAYIVAARILGSKSGIVFAASVVGVILFSRLSTAWWVRILALVCLVVTTVMTFQWSNWLVGDLAFVVVAAIFLSALLNILESMFVLPAVCACAATLFDVVTVYFRNNLVDNVSQATNEPVILPASFFQVPERWGLHSSFGDALGMTDVLLPGILILIAAELAYRHQRPALAYWALGGYAVGLVVGLCVLDASERDQPALLFLAPATLIGALLGAWRTRLARELLGLQDRPGSS